MKTRYLHSFIHVRGRFHRSVQLVRDAQDRVGLSEYLLTPTARKLTEQILDSARRPTGQRAWSITGPYGTGKSAFALFLTEFLCQPAPAHPEAQRLRKDLHWAERPFLPVLLVGQRASFRPLLFQSIAEAIQPLDPALARKLRAWAGPKRDSANTGAIIQLVAEAAQTTHRGGILIIVDEFGKFLEYAAQHPDTEDLLVLQELAEAIARSTFPFIFINILHTAFAEYLLAANQAQRVEWQKVQGRFASITFLEPPEQLLQLVGRALDRRELPRENEMAYQRALRRMFQSPGWTEVKRRFSPSELFDACIPLHPVTALILWPVFRSKLAQNERSLFAFLAGTEPFGFGDFLKSTPIDSPSPRFFRLDQFYDYVTTALGTAVYTGDQGHRWSEIAGALDRLTAGAPELSASVIKSVGLLRLYGKMIGLDASREILEMVLGDEDALDQALDFLVQNSILLFRKHDKAYALWEGSDVDLGVRYEEALRHVDERISAERLQDLLNLRPLVARRHYIRTGTLRYFTPRILPCTESALREALARNVAPADGQILFVLPTSTHDRRVLLERALELTQSLPFDDVPRLLAFPKPVIGLAEAARDVECWRWVMQNVPALQGDPVARREVLANLQFAQTQLEKLIGQVFGLEGQLFDPNASEWIYCGEMQSERTPREFTAWLSEICDSSFSQAPVLRNELLNRRHLSSAAAAARRNLLEAMLTHGHLAHLGVEGTPPEVSMYRSLLQQGGFHRSNAETQRWQFSAPSKTWRSTWKALTEFIHSTTAGRRPISDLFTLLTRPPFGLRDGPLPVLLCAFLLSQPERYALYEDGLFVPELRIEVLERLTRAPEQFEIQEYVLTDDDRQTLVSIQASLRDLQVGQPQTSAGDLLVQIVRDLTVFVSRLPTYTKQTRRLNPSYAIGVRDVLLRARDPLTLMQVELPAAVGVAANASKGSQQFAGLLREAISGLQRAYPGLLDEIEAQTRQVFDLQGSSGEVCELLRQRALPLDGLVAERNLALFIKEAGRLNSDTDWRTVVGRAVNQGLPPLQWRDLDVTQFQVRLVQIAGEFARLTELAAEKRLSGAGEVLRLGVLDGRFHETRAIVSVTKDRAPAVDRLAQGLNDLLGEVGESEEDRRIKLAALARVVARYLESEKTGKNV